MVIDVDWGDLKQMDVDKKAKTSLTRLEFNLEDNRGINNPLYRFPAHKCSPPVYATPYLHMRSKKTKKAAAKNKLRPSLACHVERPDSTEQFRQNLLDLV